MKSPGGSRRGVVVLVAAVVLALVAALAIGAGFWAQRKPDAQTPSASVAAPSTAPPSPSDTGDGTLSNLGHTWGMKEYETFYAQRVTWGRCEDADREIQCASVKVPMDWTQPGNGKTVDLKIARRPAQNSKQRLGAIVYDPGGPGGSGVDFVIQDPVLTEDLARRYDVVGIDPRGVGGSAPVDCVSDAQLDTWLAGTTRPWTEDGFQRATKDAKTYADGCRAKTGELLGFVDTWSAARDLDVIRAALGEEKLSYLGASYGTLLGAEYARFYPERVGRFVLDGAMDPRMTADQTTLVQAKGFEKALRAYVAACLRGDTGDCPLTGDVNAGVKQVQDFIDSVDKAPLKSGNRELTGALAVTGIITPLYDDQSWFILSQALQQGLEGDPTTLLYMSDVYADRDDNGKYGTNSMEAFTAINCIDYPLTTDKATIDKRAQELIATSPTFGRWMAYGEITCAAIGLNARTPSAVKAEGSAPILVVGTTGDPATPYEWAQGLASQLSNGRLLTYEGEGHTAYNRGSDCINKAIDGYFERGTVPADGTRCK